MVKAQLLGERDRGRGQKLNGSCKEKEDEEN
jgi:hypothetical protein